MRIVSLKLPEGYIPVLKRTIEELKNTENRIIYLWSPPGYGKTTTLLKFFQETGYYPLFLQLEEKDKDIDNFKISLLRIFSEFSGHLREIISLTDEKTLVEAFFNIIENSCGSIVFPENTYFIFLDTFYLMENFGNILKGIILPLFGKFDVRVIIEANLPFEFNNEVKIMGSEFFTLDEEEIIKVGDILGEKIDNATASFIKEKTEGWFLPIILFFKDKRDLKVKLEMFKEWPELLNDLLERIFEKMSDEDRLSILALGQLKEFSYGAVKHILGYDFPERIIRNMKEKGFVLIEEVRKGVLNFRFHRLIKSWLEKKMSKLPLGMELSLRIHANAMEYFEGIQDFENALYHAIKLGDFVRMGKYFKSIVIDMFNEGRIKEVEGFFNEIGEERIEMNDELLLCYGIYLNLTEKYKESLKILEKIKEKMEPEDRLLCKYYIILCKEALGEKEDLLLQEAQSLLDEVKKYEENPPEITDFEKDPWKIVRRRVIKSPAYFVSLMYGRIFNFMGNIYSSKREMNRAREFYTKSIQYLKKIGDDRRIMTVVHNLGNIELFFGKKEAMDYFLDVISYPVDFPGKANSLNNIGICYEIYLGDLDRAEEYYHKAWEMNLKFKQERRIITNVANLLYIYTKKGEKEKIYEFLEKLEELVEKQKDPRLTNLFYMGNTEIMIELGEIEKAKRSFEKINEIEVLKREDDKYYRIYVEGKLRYAEGFSQEGKNLIEKSLEWTLKNSSFTDKIDKLYFIYRLYKKHNDPEMYRIREIARKLLDETQHPERHRDFDINTS